MLHKLLTQEREAILADCQERVITFGGQNLQTTSPQSWGLFYDQLADLLITRGGAHYHAIYQPHLRESDSLAREHVRLGNSIAEVIGTYRSLAQSIIDTANVLERPLNGGETNQLHLAIDGAICDVVSEFERLRDEQSEDRQISHLGYLAHELRNQLQAATISLSLMESGVVGIRSNSANVLQDSLQQMASLIDTSLAEVRLNIETAVKLKRHPVYAILSHVGVTASVVARNRELRLSVEGETDAEVMVDKQLIVAALANLVQNAMKFTKPHTSVHMWARRSGDRVLIEVSDHCGGLQPGVEEKLFQEFFQNSEDQTGVGLGLTISRRAVERNRGTLRVANNPGIGCTFTIDLPSAPPVGTAPQVPSAAGPEHTIY